MADALASGASVRKDVGVQVPPRAPDGKAEEIECELSIRNLDDALCISGNRNITLGIPKASSLKFTDGDLSRRAHILITALCSTWRFRILSGTGKISDRYRRTHVSTCKLTKRGNFRCSYELSDQLFADHK